MDITYEYRLQNVISQLRTTANQFSNAASAVQSRAEHLAGISLDITYSANDWSGQASSAFQNTWMQYDLDTRKAIATLKETTNALNNLAQRLEQIIEEKRNAEMREDALLMATFGLTLVDMLQLGLDPATDALTAATAAGAAARVAEAIDIEALVEGADMVAEGELSGIFSPQVNILNELNEGEFVNLAGGNTGGASTDIFYVPMGDSSTAGDKGPNFGWQIDREDGKSSLTYGISASLFSQNKEQRSGSIFGAPVTNIESLDIGNGSLGAGIQPGNKKGQIFVGIQGGATLLDAEMGQRIGSKDLGLVYTDETKVLDAEGFVGVHNDSIGADAGIDFVSDTVNGGVDIGGVNLGLDATIGIKAELGFQIGKKTEIKLPFVSFGIDFGNAK